jgi:hypothetical protein
MSELDRLRGLGSQIVPPPFELLRDTAHRRARRNRIAGALAASVAVAVVVVSAAVLTGTDDSSAPEPVAPPYDVSTTHPLTYGVGTTIHYGDRTVEVPATVLELDVTDAGVVARTEDGGIWFTDGTALDQVGTLGEPGSAFAVPDHPYGTSWGFVVSDNTGARAAWLEFPRTGEPELVVYNTRTAEESARMPLGVEPGTYALLAGVTDRYGYWYTNPETVEDDVPLPQQRLDLASGTSEAVTWETYEADRPGPGSPRTMTVSHAQGDEPVVPKVVDATAWQFDVRGDRVEPQGAQPMHARDGGTGQRFAFDAPERYPNAGPGWLTQWLDGDTVVITLSRGGKDDLLECRHSTGECTLAQRLPEVAVLPEVN